jgi:chorismate-pyruvate lyase
MLHVHHERGFARARTCARLLFGVLIAIAPVDLSLAAAPDGFVRGLEMQAVLQTLRAELLGHDSSTAVLQSWCEAHGPPGLKIVALHDPKAERAPSEAARKALDLKPGQAVRYRRVRLACGQTVLSEADNWYLPERLTPDMNHALDTSDAPFGAVVRPLGFRRRFLSAELLFHPLPDGWEKRAPEPGPAPKVPSEVLTDTAVLTAPDGRPFSFVAETYTAATLQMALPKGR